MEIGIDSFAGNPEATDDRVKSSNALNELLDRIEHADKVGLDIFGIGNHYRKEFLDSATSVILAAAAARTSNIRLSSAVTVLSSEDPVRVFQQFATLDLISKGRAEIVVGRGSFTESFPLFGLELKDYDSVFSEKLDLLLQLRENVKVSWEGQFRPGLIDQEIYPRPLQKSIPIWLGVGGTPASFVRAGRLGLPLMVAIIGGETSRFRSLIDLYRKAGKDAGHPPEKLSVGLHSLGYVARDAQKAMDEYYPGYAESFTKIGRERGWPPVTRSHFDSQAGPSGAIVVGDPKQVAEKIVRHSKALGGISRFTFQMDIAGISNAQLMEAINLIGKEVKPLVLAEA